MAIQILFQAHGILAVDKPPGVAVHATPGPGISLLRELHAQTGLPGLTPVHRLDKDASGVLLLAESKAVASELQAAWPRVEKTYLALTDGLPAEPQGRINAPILEHQTGKPERLANALRYFQELHPGVALPPLPAPKTSAVHPAGRASQTHYTVLESFRDFALLEVRPLQGRMHQIRVHLAHAGFALAVDPLYGKRASLRKRDVGGRGEEILIERLSLHASKLVFEFKGETHAVSAPLPNDFQRALQFLRAQKALPPTSDL
jgi:tRNA pseudouridine32 synthase/23S rRNA pseudouridine746 synthase